MIFDRTWSGKIIGVRIKNVPGRLRGSGRGVSYDWNDAICLAVRKSIGTKGLVVYRPGETNNKFCVLCGTQQSVHNERCNDCGHTLIDPGHIYETKHSK